MREVGFVSMWLGVAPDPDTLERYVALTFSEDGELIPSQFMSDFCLPRWDEMCREAEYFSESGMSTAELLCGFSYDSELIPQFEQIVGAAPAFPVNSAILLYNFNHRDAAVKKTLGAISLNFMGVGKYSM